MDWSSLVIAEVADLPWAFNPFKCAHKERFDELVGDDPPRERSSKIFGEMVAALSEPELERCPYHRGDWAAAAEAAIEARELGLHPRSDEFQVVVEKHGAAWRAAESFFGEPIWIDSDGQVGNGQHRICALKCAGVKRCLIER